MSSSSASNASSSFIRSQTHRPSMRFGRGIRPSATISSNFVTPTPIYSAAWTRERPRGASEGGKQLTEFRTIRLDSLIDCGSLHSQCAVARLSQDRIREADLTRTFKEKVEALRVVKRVKGSSSNGNSIKRQRLD